MPDPRRRSAARIVAALSAGLLLSAATPGSAGAQPPDDDFVPGSGMAYAQVMRAGPTAARLSLAPVIGLSLADYLTTTGRGETKVADWAGIGVAERALPDNTPQLFITSNDEGAEEGVTETIGAPGAAAAEMFVRATRAPMGESRFTLGLVSVPGVFELVGGQTHTSSGIITEGDHLIRQSTATTEISRVDLAGGAVTLTGLRWEAIQRTAEGRDTEFIGSFSLEGASIGDTPLPVPASLDSLEPLFEAINTALFSFGFGIEMPDVSTAAEVAAVSPLAIRIADSPFGREYLAPILAELQPAREPVVDLFIELAKTLHEESDEEITDLTVGVLAADLVLGVLSGASQLHLELGGVNAFTEGERIDSPFGEVELGAVAPALLPVPGEPAIPGEPGIPPTTIVEEGEFVAAPIPDTRNVPGDRGGIAVIVGLIGIAVAIALAGADWYRMRVSARGAT